MQTVLQFLNVLLDVRVGDAVVEAVDDGLLVGDLVLQGLNRGRVAVHQFVERGDSVAEVDGEDGDGHGEEEQR